MNEERCANHFIPIWTALESWTDDELLTHYSSEKPTVSKVRLAGCMAKRSAANPKLLESLEAEAESDKARQEVFFGFIKMSWIPVLSVLEHGSDQGRAQLHLWIDAWTETERGLFLDYLAKEPEFRSWFNPHKLR